MLKRSAPAAPELAVPVENTSDPLTPAAPALFVLMMMEPELEADPSFATNDIVPPVKLWPRPA